uniref:Claudin 30 n=1 Tax=Hippocampus comes TaxID=109280 RepID=A0A3Q3DB83_HIPCM
MASTGTQLLGSGLCLLGWAGVIICCLLPMWRVTAFVGSTIVTSQTIWEGIWMSCVVQSTGQIQCKPYESTLALSADLQAARALTVLAAATGAAGLLLAFVGGKCTRFLEREGPGPKGRVAAAAGALLVLAGALCLIPTAWAAGAVVRKFYAASVDAQRRELGACLYVGWGASVLLVLGGGLFIGGARPLEGKKKGPLEKKSPLANQRDKGYAVSTQLKCISRALSNSHRSIRSAVHGATNIYNKQSSNKSVTKMVESTKQEH